MIAETSIPLWVWANLAFFAIYLPAHGYVYYRYRSRDSDCCTASEHSSAEMLSTEKPLTEKAGSLSCGGLDPSICCPWCGTENEAGYRYCRSCVSGLGA